MPLSRAHACDRRCAPSPAAAVHLDKVICHALPPDRPASSTANPAARVPPSPSLAGEAPWLPLLLELEDAQRVLTRVDDERGPGEPEVGDAVLGLQTGQVVFLDCDPA
jgi:hypothetical protein